MRHLYVIDPLEKLNLPADTSFLLMRECCARGHEVYRCTAEDIRLQARDGKFQAAAICTKMSFDEASGGWQGSPPRELDISEFSLIHIRKDPPFDDSYRALCLILQEVKGPTIINSPQSLASQSEKLAILGFPEYIADTLVSADPAVLAEFAKRVGGKAIAKPLGEAAGRGIALVGPWDLDHLGAMTRGGRVPIMVQRFLPEVVNGETRIFLLAGEPLSWIRKFPPPGSFIANFDPGSRAEPCTLDQRELAICAALKPYLQRWGFVLASVDILAGNLLEINVTSPGLLVESNRINGTRCERAIVDYFEKIAEKPAAQERSA